MPKRLDNKVIILTGATGLIGKKTTEHMRNNGALVIAVDVNINEDVETNIQCDVTDDKKTTLLIDRVLHQYGRIDGLVNLAYPRTSDWGKKFEDIPLESWRKNVDMQMNGVFFICQKVLAIMRQQERGSIVNIASIYGVVGNDFTMYEAYGGNSPAAYSAIKGGIINFTRYLASYYGRYNIRVNCVSPGGILDETQQHPSFIERYSEKSPLKRLGKPEEIAPAITFLLSDESSFITGHNLMVDGGWTAI